MYNENELDGYGEEETPLVFYHKNGEFRKYEPKEYSDMATGKNQPKHGLFRDLVGTRGNRMMFFVVVMCFALVLIVSLLTGRTEENVLEGVSFKLSAFAFSEKIYVSVDMEDADKKNPVKDIKKFSFLVTAFSTEGQAIDSFEGSWVYEGAREKKQALTGIFEDYDIEKIVCSIKCGDKSAEISGKVHHK